MVAYNLGALMPSIGILIHQAHAWHLDRNASQTSIQRINVESPKIDIKDVFSTYFILNFSFAWKPRLWLELRFLKDEEKPSGCQERQHQAPIPTKLVPLDVLSLIRKVSVTPSGNLSHTHALFSARACAFSPPGLLHFPRNSPFTSDDPLRVLIVSCLLVSYTSLPKQQFL